MYYTESDANGNFTIKMGPYTDALGKTRHFDADASAGLTTGDDRGKRDQKREKIRVWTELPENMTDKYRLVHQPAAGIFPGIGANTTPTTQGDAQWGGNKITGMTIQYAQKDKLPQHLPENKWAESTGTGGNEGTYAGRAFWNLDVLQGALNHNTVSAFGGKDIPAAGMKVVGSYLTDDAVNKIETYAKDNFAGKTLRGKGWTPADEAGLQKWINEQVAADPEGWIAETVTTTTGANGRFALKWKGIYGNSHNSRGIVPADKAGKLAGSPGEGRWTNGALDSKHVNMHWSYVSILGKDGKPLPDNIGALYPWALGQWAGPGFGADLNAGANAQLFGGDGALIGNTTDSYTGWNIALAPQALKFDVVDKNTSDNWAALGDKVQTDTAGLPIADNLNYYIEWVDKNGKVVKTCETAKADSATKIPSCELEVPADAQTGDTFTARLKVTPNNPDPKNDLVLAMDAFAVARDYLEYEPVDAKADEKATSEPKFDNPETEPEETKPEKAKFELGKLPEGVTEDQVEVDPATGAVTFTPTAAQVGKTFDFPVVMRDEALQVPVLDENGDPVKDEEGNAKTQGRIVARADATFNLADATANTVEPKYEDKLVVPGEETKSSPTFTDKDGKDVEVPADSKFTISEDFKAPEGYEVNIDKNTGEITVTVDGDELDKDTVEEFDVPVTVTYPDGSTDKTDANFKLDTDGDGKPDTTEEDDDGDGIPDEEEKEKGSNPKDKGSIPATPIEPGNPTDAATVEPEYEDGSGKPGEDVTVPAPEFKDKDGKETKAPEGTKFTPGDDAPEGVNVDENTGEITVPVPEDANPGDKITVPVEVTYPDGSKDNVDVTVTVEQPDAPETPDTKTADELEPKYNGGAGQPGKEAPVDAPTFTDEDGNKVIVPEGTKFATDKDGVEVAEDGSLKVQIPEDATPGTEFTVPVVVTYPDESTDKVDVTVTVTDPDAKPEWGNHEGEPGGKVTVPNTGGDVPEGSTVETEGPGEAEIDDNGNLIVDIDEDAKPGEKVVVIVKDKDGNKIGESTVTVTEPSTPSVKDEDKYEPEYEDGKGEPGKDVKVPAPNFKDKDGNPTTAPDGTTFKPGDKAPKYTDKDGNEKDLPKDNVIVDPNTGEITVKVPEDAKPDQKITVPVEVTYPDGSKDNVDVNVTVGKPDNTGGSSDGSGSSDLSSNQRCINTGLGVGIPLLFLIPVGLASQMNIPGLSDFVAPINKQIRDLNTQLQKQAGVFNGPLAGKMAGIDAQLKRFGVDHQQAAGAVALIAAGALAIGLIADACAPGGGSSNGSSK